MKKSLSLILAAALCLGLLACGGDGETKAPQVFSVGFGRADITSKASIPLAGYGNTTERMSEGFLTPLYATCVAITDETGKTVMFYTIDHVCTNADWMPDLRAAVTEATGVPGECILMSATHTHSGPDVRDQVTPTHPYYAIYKQGLVDAAVQAMADSSPATVHSGSTTVDGLNFVRHYYMSDGNMAGDNYGDFTVAKAVDNHHKADNEVQIINFVRQDKKDVVMFNFQVHPKLTSTASSPYGLATRMLQSADVVYSTVAYMEKTADVLGAYFQGAAGNLNPLDSYIPAHNSLEQTDYTLYGKKLGGAVLDALANLPAMTVAPTLTTKQTTFEVPHRNGGDPNRMELNAVRLGNIGFVTAPYEMFDTNGIQIKDGSPFETTFVITYANGRFAYIPSDEVWDYATADGSVAYEITLGYVNRGAGEVLVEQFLSMLKEVNVQ